MSASLHISDVMNIADCCAVRLCVVVTSPRVCEFAAMVTYSTIAKCDLSGRTDQRTGRTQGTLRDRARTRNPTTAREQTWLCTGSLDPKSPREQTCRCTGILDPTPRVSFRAPRASFTPPRAWRRPAAGIVCAVSAVFVVCAVCVAQGGEECAIEAEWFKIRGLTHIRVAAWSRDGSATTASQ